MCEGGIPVVRQSPDMSSGRSDVLPAGSSSSDISTEKTTGMEASGSAHMEGQLGMTARLVLHEQSPGSEAIPRARSGSSGTRATTPECLTTMGACYTTCAANKSLPQHEMVDREKKMTVAERRRHLIDPTRSVQSLNLKYTEAERSNEESEVAELGTDAMDANQLSGSMDLEELGAKYEAELEDSKLPSTGIEVDYEDTDGVDGQPLQSHRPTFSIEPKSSECAPNACQPLDGKVPASGKERMYIGTYTSDSHDIGQSTKGSRRRRAGSTKEETPEKDNQRSEDEDAASDTTFSTETASPFDDVHGTNVPHDVDEDNNAPTRCSSLRKLCLCEVSQHTTATSCWLVANKNVYDVTGVMSAHPAGPRSILRKAGGPDCTKDMNFHSKSARRMLEKCFIGRLQCCGDDSPADQTSLHDGTHQAPCNIM